MKFKSALFFCLFISCATCAQKGFVSGFYLNPQNPNDTVRGLVSVKNDSKFAFKKNGEADSKEYDAQEVMAFGVTGKRYFESRTLPEAKKIVFVEILVKGKATLLKFHGKYYLENAKGQLFMLTIETKKVLRTNPVTGFQSEYEVLDKKYLQVLGNNFSDCEAVLIRIKNVTYGEHSFVKIFSDYNSYFGGTRIVTKKNLNEHQFEIGAEFGNMSSKIGNLPDQYNSFMNFNQFEGYSQNFLGAFIRYSSPRIDERVSFMIEFQDLFYSHYSSKDYQAGVNTHDDVFLSYKCLKIPVSIGYDFRGKNRARKFYPSLRFGLSYNVNSGIKNIEVRTTYLINAPPLVEEMHPFYTDGNTFMLFGRAGLNYNFGKVVAGIIYGYESGACTVDIGPISPKRIILTNSGFTFNLSYCLGKK